MTTLNPPELKHVENAIYQIPEYAEGCAEVEELLPGHYGITVARVRYLTKDTQNIVTESVVIDYPFLHSIIKGMDDPNLRGGITPEQARYYKNLTFVITDNDYWLREEISAGDIPVWLWSKIHSVEIPQILEAIYRTFNKESRK